MTFLLNQHRRVQHRREGRGTGVIILLLVIVSACSFYSLTQLTAASAQMQLLTEKKPTQPPPITMPPWTISGGTKPPPCPGCPTFATGDINTRGGGRGFVVSLIISAITTLGLAVPLLRRLLY